MLRSYVDQLDADYQRDVERIAEIVKTMAANRAQADVAMIQLNKQETGVEQAPRPISFWREKVIEDLPIQLETKESEHGGQQ